MGEPKVVVYALHAAGQGLGFDPDHTVPGGKRLYGVESIMANWYKAFLALQVGGIDEIGLLHPDSDPPARSVLEYCDARGVPVRSFSSYARLESDGRVEILHSP